IKGALKKLVQINQSAFIPERIIQDNILLSQEILKGYGRKNGAKRSLNHAEKEKIKNVMQFEEGIIPTKYLGVPLITKMLSVKDCQILIDRIKVGLKIGKSNGDSVKERAKVAWKQKERNQRIFRGEKRNADNLQIAINEVVQVILMNIKVKDSNALKNVADTWGIQFKNH
nr:RNA-directed DNA polymerase, eukaryota, reverse transcriptase zinc-binding domain protein [Tanacetum cinerariifolium]